MKLLSPTPHKRLNEATGLLLLAAGLVLLLSLISYHTLDPSWDTASSARPLNLMGYPGAYLSDLFFQVFGAGAFLFPLLSFVLAWRWIRSTPIEAGAIKSIGALLLSLSACAALSFAPIRLFSGTIRLGGTLGFAVGNYLMDSLNLAGALLATATAVVISLYLVLSFTLATLAAWLNPIAAWISKRAAKFSAWREAAHQRAVARAKERDAKRIAKAAMQEAAEERKSRKKAVPATTTAAVISGAQRAAVDLPPWQTQPGITEAAAAQQMPEAAEPPATEYGVLEEIPICPIEELPPPAPIAQPVAETRAPAPPAPARRFSYDMPATELLNEVPGRQGYDEAELWDIAGHIKSKCEEFNVMGSVVRINPGPVVTTFEFKPDAGVKVNRVTSLSEDLCLGLQAESILIERIPGKPTVGIEVPNSKREVISLRQMIESDEFQQSPSHLTIALGKDINGRIRVTSLETMPHLLIAGSTGSGKSVMINSMVMSILYKATPDDVRFIMVDPKRVELGIYENIPHLLTPVIVDTKKATNALRNAVLEMERRLRLLAEYGARNIDQFNKKVRKMQEEPRNLFDEEAAQDELKPLPYILILIDELADLMMLEGKNVEESVTRLAQMARAVGMHLVLATQRPSVDVITGLIKANFPARISFRVATRIDSRTILDDMGAEHLLGKGDMLFRPPGSSRFTRVHGAFVTESEIGRVVDFWKEQAKPEYDQSFLIAPPSDEEAGESEEVTDADQDPMYEEAVRLVLQMGKASTSTLQRHLRLGYGRAARILDMMQRDGIIGPPDGSKPREVLKRPDWLREVESQPR